MTPTVENISGNRTAAQETGASILGSLFNFDRFITARLVKIIFTLGAALVVLGAAVSALTSLALVYNYGGGMFFTVLLQLVMTVVGGAAAILILRIYCEFVLVIFKINDNLQVVRDRSVQL